MSFHEVRFPVGVSYGSSGGPERRTEIATLGSGFEERNSPWTHSRRRYDAGYGVRDLNDLHAVIAFFEARHGRLYGFCYYYECHVFHCTSPARAAASMDARKKPQNLRILRKILAHAGKAIG